MTSFTQLNHCMVCGGRSLSTGVDLGQHAIASRFPAPGEPDSPSGPLVLKECLSCGHVQLSHRVDPDEIWRPGYGYRSSVNETMRDHLQDIAHSLIGLLRPTDVVIDIGSNDGELLRHIGGYFPGVRRIGVDPLGEPVDGAEIIREYFGTQALPRARIITSIAMFYDVPSPVAFVQAVARALAPDGIWILEVAHLSAMWEGAWDGICHEHLGYYGLRAIRNVAKQAGMVPVAVTQNSTNGGSVRVWLTKEANPTDIGQLPTALENSEEYLNLEELAKEIAIAGKALRRLLVDISGAKVMAMGASTKGNTLLQSCLSPTAAREFISAAVERFPEKVGRRLPGSGIPIISEADALANPPDYFLVLPWHFRESILARYKARYPKTTFIFPLPKLEVVI